MIKYTFLILIVVLACMLFLTEACRNECINRAGAREYEEMSKSFQPNNSVVVRTFDSLSVEKQIDVFLYSKGCRNDPRIEPLLIRNGQSKIPSIVGRIETEGKIWDKINLVTVLIGINTRCECIHADSETIIRLENVSREVDGQTNVDTTYKQSFDESIKSLKGQLKQSNLVPK